MNTLKEIEIKNRKYYFFDDMINIKNLGPNKIKINEKWNKLHKINSVNPLYLIINKVNGYIEENNGNKYLMLVPTGKSKDILKEVWRTIDQNKRSN